MRHDTANTLRRAAQPIVSFECSGCAQMHFKKTETLPEKWTVELIDGEEHAFCKFCSAEREALRGLGLDEEETDL